MSIGSRRRRQLIVTALVLLGGVGAAAFALTGKPSSTQVGDPTGAKAAARPVPVKTIRPKRDPSFQVTSRQLATVEAYFQEDLRARTSGVVTRVAKDINQRVRRGELLIDIDAPDLQQDVIIKEGVVAQRQLEVKKARDEVRIARAHVEVAKANVELRQKEVGLAAARRDLAEKRLERYRGLLAEKAIVPDVFDEQERDWKVAVAAVEVAEGAVQKALADQKEMEASLEDAQDDIVLKEALVEVARRDLARARATADFAHVYARFDGVITRRNVDPGAFVQNASTGSNQPLMSVARTDLVTVVAKVPDNEAAFIGPDTEVEIEIDNRPGLVIAGRVTRYSPSVQNEDRTMRVEVDLFNGSAEEYAALRGQVVAGALASLTARDVLGAAPLFAGAANVQEGWQKSTGDPLPLRPGALGSGAGQRLLPGMTGIMELHLSRTAAAFLLPSSAVYNVNGKPYILVVKDGKSVQVPVRVQVDDGTVAKVDVLVSGDRRGFRELMGNEEVIASRQIEVGEGRAVAPTLSEWGVERHGH